MSAFRLDHMLSGLYLCFSPTSIAMPLPHEGSGPKPMLEGFIA